MIFYAYRRFLISPAINQILPEGRCRKKDNGGGAFERARAKLSPKGRPITNQEKIKLFEFLWRYEDFNTFSRKATRFGIFPRCNGRMGSSEEGFWKNNIFSHGLFKVRRSWGQMGNDQIFYDGSPYRKPVSFHLRFPKPYLESNRSQNLVWNQGTYPTGITWEVGQQLQYWCRRTASTGANFFRTGLFLFNLRTNIFWRKNAISAPV